MVSATRPSWRCRGSSSEAVAVRTLVAVALGALFFVGASAVGPRREIGRAAAAPGQVAVTVSSATFVDATRGTPARVGSPAKATRTIHELIYNPVGDPGPLPTVMFAPGWDSQSALYDPLLRAVAFAGFVVVGVDSPGSSSYFPGAPLWSVAGEDIANNTRDLSAALTNLESGPFAPRIDRAAVAAVGHSNGGSEVANLALNRVYNSSRFNAYVVLSGVLPFGQVTGSFGPLNNGPMLMAVGTADEYGNYSPRGGGTEGVYGAARSSKIMLTIQGASHLSAFVGSGPQADDTRAAIANFLNVAERHDPGARASFDAEVKMDGLSSTAVLDPGWYAGPAVVVFTLRPGFARDIAVGANGFVWVVGTNQVPGGYGLYRWNGDTWSGLAGGAVSISVDASGHPWVTNSADQIWRWNGAGWTLEPGFATDIAVGTNGSVWVVGTNKVPGGYGIYRWNGTSWVPQPGGAVTISVDPSGLPWVINSAHQIWRWNGAGWVLEPGSATDISVGGNGSVWLVGANKVPGGYGIYRWNGIGWVPQSGGAVTIAVDPTGSHPWVTNSQFQIFSS
jgi:dienelactone hydrolase